MQLTIQIVVVIIVGALAAAFGGYKGTVVISVDPAREKFALPSVFNFDEFKQKFEKQFESGLEEAFRESLFNARLVRAFASAINYKNSNSNSYLSLNDRSDLTNEEFLKSFGGTNNSSINNLLLGLLKSENDTPRDIVGGQTKNEVTLTLTETTTPKRPLVLLRKKRELGDKLLQAEASGGQTRKASKLSSFLSKFWTNKKDFVRKDLRKTGCLSSARNQGSDCNVSYIFATLAAYEYKYCMMQSIKLEFSAQFPVDCGHLSGLNGCQEADLERLISFIDIYGLETTREYSYYGHQLACPYETDTPPLHAVDMGRFKMATNLQRISIEKFDKYIAKSEPIIIRLKVPDNFDEYEGGVDSVTSCDGTNGFVTMLLVGSGREDGQDYWLFRNSRSTSWGEDGYYKLNQRSQRCIADNYGLIIRPLALKRNPWRRVISDKNRPNGGPPVIIASL